MYTIVHSVMICVVVLFFYKHGLYNNVTF